MPNHVWSVLCQSTSVDQQTNNLSIFQVMEQVQIAGGVPELPAGERFALISMPAVLVSLWERTEDDPERASGRIKFRGVDGDELVVSPPFPLALESSRLRTTWTLQGVPFAGAGRYQIDVELEDDEGWTTVASIPLQIDVA